MCVCARVCVHVCMCACVRVRACVCECVREHWEKRRRVQRAVEGEEW